MSVKNYSTGTFQGGIHPDYDGKDLSQNAVIEVAPLYEKYEVAIQQNIGKAPKLIVAVGDEVKKGQKIAEADGFVSVPLHSPTSGVVEAITQIPGPMGVPVNAVVIKSDMKDEWGELAEPLDWRNVDGAVLKQRIADAGIVGMGGAAFPSAVKLSPPPEKKITALVINGAECEPYLTADHRLMLEAPERVLTGAAIMGKILGVENIYIGVELNKKDAIDMLLAHAEKYNIKIVGLKVQYPQGAEKQLIYAVTDRKVPAGGLPMDAGVVVQNTATCAAVADAVIEGKPLIDRVTTITGEAVKNPGNWRLKIGTPVREAIKLAGGTSDDVRKVILGGPMMGFAQKSLDVTIQKNSSGVLIFPESKVVQYQSGACIRCGRCLQGCPMKLNPALLGRLIENEKFDLALQNNIMDCIECGSCAFICPAHRPLVQHMRRAKAEIRNMKK